MLLLCTGNLRAQGLGDTLQIKQTGTYALNEYLYYYKNVNNLTIKEVSNLINTSAFKKLYPEQAINSGITSEYYWLTFSL